MVCLLNYSSLTTFHLWGELSIDFVTTEVLTSLGVFYSQSLHIWFDLLIDYFIFFFLVLLRIFVHVALLALKLAVIKASFTCQHSPRNDTSDFKIISERPIILISKRGAQPWLRSNLCTYSTFTVWLMLPIWSWNACGVSTNSMSHFLCSYFFWETQT
jgi:hypothetical protein